MGYEAREVDPSATAAVRPPVGMTGIGSIGFRGLALSGQILTPLRGLGGCHPPLLRGRSRFIGMPIRFAIRGYWESIPRLRSPLANFARDDRRPQRSVALQGGFETRPYKHNRDPDKSGLGQSERLWYGYNPQINLGASMRAGMTNGHDAGRGGRKAERIGNGLLTFSPVRRRIVGKRCCLP
jgi:hypothetical protein